MNSIKLRFLFLFCLATIAQTLNAQNYTLPEEYLNAKNGVKLVTIYSENDKEPRKLVARNRYDKLGRIIQGNGDGNTNVVRYFYDESNRYSSIQISQPSGKFFRKTLFKYDVKKGTTLMSHYANSKDSTQITSSVLEDSLHRTIRKTAYMEGREHDYVEFTYGNNGEIIGQKDSSAQTLTVNIYLNNELRLRKLYSPKNVLLHTYHFYYSDPYTIKAITDSVSGNPDTYLIERKETYGAVSKVMKNGNTLSEQEHEIFTNLFPMVELGNQMAESEAPFDGNLKQQHELVRDANGNIVKDTLTMSQGSYRQVLIFVYEYEYF